jgi:hypothetical protein
VSFHKALKSIFALAFQAAPVIATDALNLNSVI